MKSLFLTLGIAIGIAGLAGRTEAQNYPCCAVYDIGDAAYNCGFVNFEQCMATVRGIGGSCMVNTTYNANPPATPWKNWRNR